MGAICGSELCSSDEGQHSLQVRVRKLPRERDNEGAGSQARSTLPSNSVQEARVETRRVCEHDVSRTPRDILQA